MVGLEHKVRLVTYNSCSDFSVNKSGLYVIVGVPSDLDKDDTHYEERNGLAEWLKENGLNVIKADCHWPRDKYVWHKNNYVYDYSYFEEGGCFVFGKNYFVASADEDFDRRRRMHTREERLKELYGTPFYMVPSMRDKEGPRGHLDLSISIIESRKLLLVDARHYRQQKRLFEKIAYEQGQKLVSVASADEGRLWPMNMLVLDNEKKTTVIANSECKRVLKILNKYDLDMITYDILDVPSLGGSIRCITNTVENLSVYRKIKRCLRNEVTGKRSLEEGLEPKDS